VATGFRCVLARNPTEENEANGEAK
jgi:hypothetical protein